MRFGERIREQEGFGERLRNAVIVLRLSTWVTGVVLFVTLCIVLIACVATTQFETLSETLDGMLDSLREALLASSF